MSAKSIGKDIKERLAREIERMRTEGGVVDERSVRRAVMRSVRR